MLTLAQQDRPVLSGRGSRRTWPPRHTQRSIVAIFSGGNGSCLYGIRGLPSGLINSTRLLSSGLPGSSVIPSPCCPPLASCVKVVITYLLSDFPRVVAGDAVLDQDRRDVANEAHGFPPAAGILRLVAPLF